MEEWRSEKTDIDRCCQMINGPSCSQSKSYSSKRSGSRRQPEPIAQLGAGSVKIIIAFCSLSRGAAVKKAECRKRFMEGRKAVADLSCSALLPSREATLDIHLSHQEAGRSHLPGWESLKGPWGKTKLMNYFVLSHQSRSENCLSSKPLHALLSAPCFMFQHQLPRLKFIYSFFFFFLSLASGSPDDGLFAHQCSFKIARN